MPFRFSRATRFRRSVSFCTRRKRGATMPMISAIIASSASTKPAVMAESVQLLFTILMMAQTAMIGALMRICRPMDVSVCTCVMSFVVRLMRLGTEKAIISCWPKSAILLKTASRME